MSKKAQERALEAYPPRIIKAEDEIDRALFGEEIDIAQVARHIYQDGYEQAEKDLAPLIEAATIVYEAWNGGTMDDVRREMVELGKLIMEKKK